MKGRLVGNAVSTTCSTKCTHSGRWLGEEKFPLNLWRGLLSILAGVSWKVWRQIGGDPFHCQTCEYLGSVPALIRGTCPFAQLSRWFLEKAKNMANANLKPPYFMNDVHRIVVCFISHLVSPSLSVIPVIILACNKTSEPFLTERLLAALNVFRLAVFRTCFCDSPECNGGRSHSTQLHCSAESSVSLSCRNFYWNKMKDISSSPAFIKKKRCDVSGAGQDLNK